MEDEDRIKAILENPSYRRADLDLEWIGSPEMKGARLFIEYAKPQLKFVKSNVRSTIVLFGGSRIVERRKAEQRLQAAKRELAQNPGDELIQRKVRIAERMLEKSRYYDVAREFSFRISRRFQKTHKREFVIITGGGPGIMEAGNRGAHDAGAKSIGLNINLPFEQVPNSYITPDLCFQFRYFAIRKMHFLATAKALVAFPGGYGTLDELFETLCLIQTKVIDPVPVILVGKDFWQRCFNAQFLAEEGVIEPEDVDLFAYAETAGEIEHHIVTWYIEHRRDPRHDHSPYTGD